MSVRDAKFADIPRIVELMDEAHRRSIYAESAEFDPIEAKQMLVRALHRHGHANYGGSLVLVSQQQELVEGFLLGILDSVYPCLKALLATDLLFILSPRADGRDARTMLQRAIAWAETNPKVIELRLGAVGAISDWRRTAKLYEHVGLEQCGAIFRRGFDRRNAA